MHTRNSLYIVFFTLLAAALGLSWQGAAGKNPARDAARDGADLAAQIVTSTPNEDGSIAHVIQYGENLIDIANAYGISLAELTSMNGLDSSAPVYFEHQVLIIRVRFTETPFVTNTFTPRPPTRTPMPSRTPRPTRTITPVRSPQPTITATAEPLIKLPSMADLGPIRPLMAYAFIGISAIGLVVLFFTAFYPGRKD